MTGDFDWTRQQIAPAPCPSCGHCPTCGRSGYQVIPWISPQPYYPSWPTWTYTTGSVTFTAKSTSCES